MDIRLKRRIANDYPYPITVEFMRLNTVEYKEHGKKRLDKILDVAETVLQFLALITISDLAEQTETKKIIINDDYRKRFRGNFIQTSFGKWAELLRETIKVFKSQNTELFITELSDYYFKNGSSPSKEQDAFNRIITIRNSISHKTTQYNKSEFEKLSMEADSLLETILKGLDFLMDYQFLYVNKITVRYHRWTEPEYDIDMSYLVGSNPELFDIIEDNNKPHKIIHTPAIVITKDNANEYLNLEPFLIYSDEGELNILDIFMYVGWDKYKSNIKYRPVWKGGAFNLSQTSLNKVILKEMLRILELLATNEDYESFKKDVELKLKLSGQFN